MSSTGYVRRAGTKISLSCFLLLAATSPITVFSDSIPGTVQHVIHISVDGLVPSAIIQAGLLTNFGRIRSEGAGTDNARADYHSTQTLPSHVSQVTGLPVEEHGWDEDGYNGGKLTPYQQNIFDLVSKPPRNGKACMYASKEKFELFQASFNMDVSEIDTDGAELTKMLIDEMTSGNPCNYAFLHLREPDAAGHAGDGTDAGYHAAVALVDVYLGAILDAIEDTTDLDGRTAVILTTDHGFATTRHGEVELLGNYRIPFYCWGPGVEAGADLYTLNPTKREDPDGDRPNNQEVPQPIRHSDAGPVAADFLGIKPNYGRFSRQDLAVALPATTRNSNTQQQQQQQQGTGTGTAGAPKESDYFFCGTNWGQAKANCASARHCPSGMDTSCPLGESCFAGVHCDDATADYPANNVPAASSPGGDNNFCGNSWTSAERKCKKGKARHCPRGFDNECPSGQSCFGGTSCSAAGGDIRKLTNLRG